MTFDLPPTVLTALDVVPRTPGETAFLNEASSERSRRFRLVDLSLQHALTLFDAALDGNTHPQTSSIFNLLADTLSFYRLGTRSPSSAPFTQRSPRQEATIAAINEDLADVARLCQEVATELSMIIHVPATQHDNTDLEPRAAVTVVYNALHVAAGALQLRMEF